MHTTAKMSAAVFVKNLSVMVGKGDDHKALLRNISLAVPEGSFLSIIGASGCGKSTLLKALAGIQPVSAGEILLAGHPVETLRQQLPLAVGYLPQFRRKRATSGASMSSISRGFVLSFIKNIARCQAARCAASPWPRN
jgi:ABC-type cobalamin/Fe3+-siderophores transport system ATPase subunit